MNAEIKKEWVEALRSGKFIQGRDLLRSRDKHCCLGVLCEIQSKHTGHKWETALSDPNSFTFLDGFYGLGSRTLNWCDLKSTEALALASMNDKGSTFEEIAKYIEEKL